MRNLDQLMRYKGTFQKGTEIALLRILGAISVLFRRNEIKITCFVVVLSIDYISVKNLSIIDVYKGSLKKRTEKALSRIFGAISVLFR